MVKSAGNYTERRSTKRFSVSDSEAQVGQFFVKLLWAHALCAIAIAFWYQTFAEAFLIGIPAALAPQILIKSKPNNLLLKASVGISLMIYSALFIHQARGMTEAHFHVFVALAFLLAYRDWRVVLAATLTIAIHHVTFAGLMFAGAPVFIFTTKASLILLTVIHAAFVVFESSVVGIIAIQGRKEWEHAEDVDRVGAMLRGLSKDRLDRHTPTEGERARSISEKLVVDVNQMLFKKKTFSPPPPPWCLINPAPRSIGAATTLAEIVQIPTPPTLPKL